MRYPLNSAARRHARRCMSGSVIESSHSVPEAEVRAPDRRRRLLWFRKRRKGLLRFIGLLFARTIAPWTLRLYSATWRYQTLEPARRAEAVGLGRGVILALWHGRMLVAIPPYRGQDMTILVSGSEDGNLSEALLDGYGYRIIRGSSSRGGARALRAMLGALHAGSTVVVTPDGPRGPRHTMNPGVAWMARATGFAVLPTGFAAQRAWRLSTWDRYVIPKPWSRVVLAYGQPIRVSREGGSEELERATARIQSEILAAERSAFRHLGREPDH